MKQGFSLIEMAVVLSLVAVITAGGMAIFTAGLQNKQRNETLSKIAEIQKRLFQYRLAFNRLPCPGDATTAVNSANYGVEGANAGSCTGGSPAANFSDTSGDAEDARGGMLPTKTLGLPDDYAIDGWGHKFMYAVSKDLTADEAFTTVTANDANTRMTINDATGAAKNTLAGYVLVSFGEDGFGSYPRNGGSTRLASIGVTSDPSPGNYDDQKNNCDCNLSSGAVVATTFDGIFVDKPVDRVIDYRFNDFDDIVVFATRSELRSLSE